MNPEVMRASSAQAARVMQLLSHPDRLLILCLLSEGEFTVGEIEQRLELHQPMLSQHLNRLRQQDLVSTRREGKYIHYQLADPRTAEIMNLLYRLYCQNSAAIES
ncbi:metalloregulator ArsR/SmtB family transcription factor [Idiomarina sp.]|uniref:ArsR/SmtB family transcription factor n=1 Tax=Idiomarina sp. TaxID=1874361 RepID=UPI000C8ADB16|nr:metalloregulator ArsR/SmtB family transcription factor [Idiomarina sp.]MAK71000.1 transcriptional regulator [Idiomarinaceae bacterium]HAD49643.1 transcriptional regulator [Idiomarina sp.]